LLDTLGQDAPVTLKAAIRAAGLSETLESSCLFTLLAPTLV